MYLPSEENIQLTRALSRLVQVQPGSHLHEPPKFQSFASQALRVVRFVISRFSLLDHGHVSNEKQPYLRTARVTPRSLGFTEFITITCSRAL